MELAGHFDTHWIEKEDNDGHCEAQGHENQVKFPALKVRMLGNNHMVGYGLRHSRNLVHSGRNV